MTGMTSAEVAEALEEIGLLLELLGENPFKTRAYGNAARIVRGLDVSLEELIDRKALGELKGIGPALADKITTLVTTGTLPYLDGLRTQLPAGILDWLKIPGLGPKKARVIHVTLGISTLAELEAAARAGKLRDLPGFGETTEKKILSGIARVRESAGRFLRPVVLGEAGRLTSLLDAIPGVTKCLVLWGVGGSLALASQRKNLKAFQAAGGKLIAIDPCRTELTDLADIWHVRQAKVTGPWSADRSPS